MFNNLSKIMFFLMLIMGTIISISSNSWMGVWMGLEINLLSFIPLITNKLNLNNSEAALNYFLIQAFTSTIMLFSMMLYMINFNIVFIFNLMYKSNSLNLSIMLMLFTLMMKMGVAPFHMWMPNVMENISWNNSMILLTWQKIAPMMILFYFINLNNLLLMFSIITTFTGAIGGLNQTSLRKLIAFSSINHLGWMIMSIMFNENMWFMYFLIYSFLNLTIIFLFKNFQLFYLNQLYSMFMNSYFLKFSLMLSTLSLGGLPPFLGFLPKWFIIQSMMFMKMNLINLFMINMSLITLYYYLKISFSAFMLNYNSFNWNYKNFFKNFKLTMMMNFNFISLFGFFISIELIY